MRSLFEAEVIPPTLEPKPALNLEPLFLRINPEPMILNMNPEPVVLNIDSELVILKTEP